MARRTASQKRRAPAARIPVRRATLPDAQALEIVHYPAAVLKRPAEDVVEIDAWLTAVAQRMTDLMTRHEGVGLAAPQVGLPLRMFIMAADGKPENLRVLINPQITDLQGQVEAEEGCLSLPDIRTAVLRAQCVTVRGYDLSGNEVRETLVDWPARIAQHENDHLEGILIIDRISPSVRLSLRQQLKVLEDA